MQSIYHRYPPSRAPMPAPLAYQGERRSWLDLQKRNQPTPFIIAPPPPGGLYAQRPRLRGAPLVGIGVVTKDRNKGV